MKVKISLFFFGTIITLINSQIYGQASKQKLSAPAGFGEVVLLPSPQNCFPAEEYDKFWKKIASLSKIGSQIKKTTYPLFDWPLEKKLHDGLILVNYVDDDNTNAIVDYMGNPHAYNGHNGTDMTLYNFRHMDRGMLVFATAEGIVVQTEYSKPDRNTEPPYPDTENHVMIRHDDGTFAWYLHLRKNSVTVEVGENVHRGQILGLVGSSGFSTDAHLHFEVGEYVGGVWNKRDPWNGTFNTLPSLWQNQELYVGTEPIRIYDMGVTTEAAVGGDLSNFPFTLFKEKLTQPAVLGLTEPFIAVWLQMQGQLGDDYTLEIRRPDNTVFRSISHSIGSKLRYGWHYWFWSFTGNVSDSDQGIWTAQIILDGNIAKQVSFEVGETTAYAPRFWPIAGRSFRINGTVQRDTLRISAIGGPVTYSLLNAPSSVTLNDSTITIAETSNQANRSLYFQAVATDTDARKDTMWYHIVDPTKPLDPPVPVELLSFTANIIDGFVGLNWLTATETNNYGFDIERKTGYTNWTKIGFIRGHGTTSLVHQYTFVDKNISIGNTYYYRLRQIDTDGSFEYSNIVKVDYVPVTFELFQNFPNPFNASTTIEFILPRSVFVELKVYDNLGQQIVTLASKNLSVGKHQINWDANGFSSGVYFCRLQAGSFAKVKKFILLK